jgi:hypothetical protein
MDNQTPILENVQNRVRHSPASVTATPAHVLESNRRSYAKRRKARPAYDARRKAKWRKSIGAANRRKISREQSARICANLSDGYVRAQLSQRLKLLPSQITQAQVEEKRRSLQTKRLRWALNRTQ